MKKTLLTIFTAVLSLSAFAQPSPSWTMQNSNFPNTSAGIRYMDAVNPNVVWAIGYDGTGPCNEYRPTHSGNYCFAWSTMDLAVQKH